MSEARWAPCALCRELVDPDGLGVYQRTSGWVQRREGGGGHSIALPERAPRFAHAACVERATRGELTQAGLFR
jgi:hypothetical protein